MALAIRSYKLKGVMMPSRLSRGEWQLFKIRVPKARTDQTNSQEIGYTAEEERKLIRKLDWIMIPMMAFGTGLQLVDKSALGSAATLTIRTDLHLVGSQYSWAVSTYCGYPGFLYNETELIERLWLASRYLCAQPN